MSVVRIHDLAAIARLGFATLFVSTVPDLDRGLIQRVRPLTARIMLRKNPGDDFGSWRDGLATWGNLVRYERLVVANDSTYGSIRDLSEVFVTMRSRGAAAWGIRDSWHSVWHLQSSYLDFERPVLERATFRDFWHNLPDYLSKHSVLVQCELG